MAPARGRRRRAARLLLSNLFRDQLDRYGELELLADRWAELVDRLRAGRGSSSTPTTRLSPTSAAGAGVAYFGVNDGSQSLHGLGHAADSKHCRNCGAPYAYEVVLMGHLGHYRCPNCGRERPAPAVAAERVVLEGMTGARMELATPAGRLELTLPLPGLYNVYNAVAATALALDLGAPLEAVRTALEGFGGAFGRVETIVWPAGPCRSCW